MSNTKSKKKANFIDTTTRDGQQSNWAYGMPIGMIAEVLEDIDNAGFAKIDGPYHMLTPKKYTRDQKEYWWEMIKLFGKYNKTPKAIMAPVTLDPWEEIWACPRSMVELYFSTIAKYGALQYVQIHPNQHGRETWGLDWIYPMFRKMGVKVTLGIAFHVSPRHQRPGYWEGIIEKYAADKPDDWMLKDAGGLLDIDSLRKIWPIMSKYSNGVPISIHGHGVLGITSYVYAEAMKLGCTDFFVGIPPLADATAQPSVFNVAENCRIYGLEVDLDFERIKRVSKRIYTMAKQMNPPLPTHFCPRNYSLEPLTHTIPGGVIEVMKYQLKDLKIQHKVDEVIEEVSRVWVETGWPHMITPYSQFVVTQAAINVATGERYKIVLDSILKFALGMFGEDSGYTEMDPNIRDKFLSLPRAKELEGVWKFEKEVTQFKTVKEVRKELDATHLSDEDFLLYYILKGRADIDAMNKAIKKRGSKTIKFYPDVDTPIVDLLNELSKQPKVTSVHISNQKGSLVLKKQDNELNEA